MEEEGSTTQRRKFAYVVYKLTFPNGKIYVGKDVGSGGHSLRYFGSWNNLLVEADFSKAELKNFVLKKEILFESEDPQEVGQMEMRLISELGSNNPAKGYNRSPKYKADR